MVLSPAALPYARLAIETLWKNSAEPVHLHLVTDTVADRAALTILMEALPLQPQNRWSVFAENDLAEREVERFARYPNLRAFRQGHPCWRKITDPLLLAEPGEEMILLDPDIYFPNRFTFEATPAAGLLLMWQEPNCLVPPRLVRAAMTAGVPLAHHVDIGVAHWRGAADLDWLDWFIGLLGGAALPAHILHVEAIVWSALAMKMGGGYLNPKSWHCWRNTARTRVMRRLMAKNVDLLRSQQWSQIKCFHAGGEAKWWLPDAVEAGVFGYPCEFVQQTAVRPFVELTPVAYEREQKMKRILRRMGYYSLFKPAWKSGNP